MALTKSEALIAAKKAYKWPKGFGKQYGIEWGEEDQRWLPIPLSMMMELPQDARKYG